ncbi:NAD-dependent DNA ligase LigB, partial [Pantoea agglomerans]
GLGMPAPRRLEPGPDWQALASKTAREWLQEPGIGNGRAEQLQAFFSDDAVQLLAAQLRHHTIKGF